MSMPNVEGRLTVIHRLFGATMLLLFAMSLALVGCARKEKVVEVQTPGGSVEVNKTTHPDGDVDVEIQTDR